MRPATSPRGALVGLAALLAGCTSASSAPGDESWSAPLAARVFVLLRGDEVEAVDVVPADGVFRRSVALSGDELAELWVVGYSDASLRFELPGLPRDPGLLAAQLDVRAGSTDGTPLPQPTGVLRASLSRDGGPLRYAPASLDALNARLGASRALRLVVDRQLACRGYEVSSVGLGTGLQPDGLVVVSSTLAVVAMTRAAGEPLVFARLAEDRVEILPPGPELAPLLIRDTPEHPIPARLAWDAPQRRVLGVDARGRIFARSLEGSTLPALPFPSARRYPFDLRKAVEVAVGRDGRTFATFRARVETGTVATIYRWDRGEWVMPIAQGQEFTPADRALLRVDRRGRLVFYQSGWVLGPENDAEDTWKQGGYDPRYFGTPWTTIYDVDLDEELAISVGKSGHVGTSTATHPGFGWSLNDLRNVVFTRVAAVGGRRAVLATDEGSLGVFRDGRECVLEERLPGSPRTSDGAPGLAVFASVDPQGRGWLTRVKVPVRPEEQK